MQEMNSKIITVGSGNLNEFPHFAYLNKEIYINPANKKRNICEVLDSRFDYYQMRLHQVEERIFSHSTKYMRPKLSRETRSNI